MTSLKFVEETELLKLKSTEQKVKRAENKLKQAAHMLDWLEKLKAKWSVAFS